MKARGSRDNSGILTLSPRMEPSIIKLNTRNTPCYLMSEKKVSVEPPVVDEDGSIVKTATFRPRVFVIYFPNVSIRLLLPAPGGPVKPKLDAIS